MFISIISTTLLLLSPFLFLANTNTQTVNKNVSNCTYYSDIAGCLDDSEDTSYSLTYEDGSTCKAEYFGYCIEGMTTQELNKLEIFLNVNGVK